MFIINKWKSLCIQSLLAAVIVLVAGCETTNSIPYKASTSNVITIQKNLKADDKKVSIGSISMAPGVESYNGIWCLR